ncbi:MAG TPA: hypothetical protein VF058_05210 [Actinomycetota bacterium]
MIRFLRRRSPGNPLLAVLYWVVLAATVVILVFALFYLLDVSRFVPGGGMF